MTHVEDLIHALLVLSGFVFLGSSRLRFCIRTLALQGIMIGLLPLWSGPRTLPARALALAALSIAIKGALLPRLLERAMQRANVRREVEPFIGYNASLFVGIVCLGISFWIAARLPLPDAAGSSLAVMAAFFTMFSGLFVIISRRQALTQVLGYLVMENGIYVFGVALALDTPALVEFGVLLDVFVAVFVMGIMIFQISRTFEHIDTDKLSALKE